MARRPEPPTPRRTGRPPKISRDTIVGAAHEIGLRDLTVTAVADHLGVSVAALYHHVGGKEDLLRLVAEQVMASRARPVDQGQHWARWLFEWGMHNWRAFVSDPGLLEQYLDGGISVDTVVDNEETVIAVLIREGFGPYEALAAFDLVSSVAIGAAVHEIRRRRGRERVNADPVEHALARRPPGDLPVLRALAAEGRSLPPPFAEHVTGLLVDLARRRGDDPDAVLTALLAD
jgi:AcrR family transcriptional regulator